MLASARLYYGEIKKICILSPEEERNLAIRMSRGDQKARALLIKGNLRLVVSIAKKYKNNGLPFLDLIEEGNLGLIKAIEKFDPNKGYKLSTYATWWIRQYILRALSKYSNTIRLPINMSETMYRFMRVIRNMVQKLERLPTIEELAEEMMLPVVRIRKMAEIFRYYISLDNCVEIKDMNMGRSSETRFNTPIDAIVNENREEYINSLFKVLNEQEIDILQQRFGLIDGEPKTLKIIGRKYGVTRERIRQIESSALKKMKRLSKIKKVKIHELI